MISNPEWAAKYDRSIEMPIIKSYSGPVAEAKWRVEEHWQIPPLAKRIHSSCSRNSLFTNYALVGTKGLKVDGNGSNMLWVDYNSEACCLQWRASERKPSRLAGEETNR